MAVFFPPPVMTVFDLEHFTTGMFVYATLPLNTGRKLFLCTKAVVSWQSAD